MMATPYFQRDGITIYHGDCREILPGLSFDVVVTDPPYSLTASGGGIRSRRRYLADIEGRLDDGFDVAILRGLPHWVVFCGKAQLRELLAEADNGGRWMLITWNKPNPTPLCHGNYLPDTEYIVHRFPSGDALGGGYEARSRFIVHPVEKNDHDHPTVKPIGVMRRLVQVASHPGQTVVDPFMGSGTTLRAAMDLGRKAIGIEIEERYCEIAARRLDQMVLPMVPV
jgi:site-specific DNA-methyltransferase (adenine-specific)